MSNGIAKWLEGLGLSEYAEVFAEQRIDEEVLPDLTDADLKDLRLPLGPRKKLSKALTLLTVLVAAVTAAHGLAFEVQNLSLGNTNGTTGFRTVNFATSVFDDNNVTVAFVEADRADVLGILEKAWN